jgi:hypothetical protein
LIAELQMPPSRREAVAKVCRGVDPG